jgi:L,D-transpeptidase catalytic domain
MLGVRRHSGIGMFFSKMSVGTAPDGAWLRACAVTAALTVPLAAPASADILITIDKSSQQMSVAVDGAQRYVWPVSTGRPGYDTPSGTFKPNRMDADHYSQEWDNAPMPHTIFFDMHGHAIHGFFDVKHLGSAVSHGCVRLSPDHAATLFNLIKAEGMSETKVVVAGRTPGGDNVPVAQQRLPENETLYNSQPTPLAPGYGQQPARDYGQPTYAQPGYAQPSYAQPTYAQPTYAQPTYAQRNYAQPYSGQSYYGQRTYAQPSYGQPSYAQPAYPPQPPPVYRQW